MTDADLRKSWESALGSLAAWHTRQDRRAAGAALTFIEVELRLRLPSAVRRRWPAEQVEDALQGFLMRLLRKPLPDSLVHQPSAYILRAFRNWCIDIERGRQREPTEPWEEQLNTSTAEPTAELKIELDGVVAALASLSLQDRVAIKMTDAPELLTWEELSWLGARANASALEIRDRVVACPAMYDLTFLFDPGEEPRTRKERRDRMERFRKRRERARQHLRAVLEVTP